MDKKEIFEKAPVHKAVFSMALPTILSMIVIILYNMANTFFVGQTHNSLYVSAVAWEWAKRKKQKESVRLSVMPPFCSGLS